MTTISRILDAVLDATARLRAAAAASAAVEAGRKPRASDLRLLGIEPAAFTSIGHG
jgi:hypothetical protein